jgi:hypothetical protein
LQGAVSLFWLAFYLAMRRYIWYACCAVLDGEVAVPCNLQSAIAGSNSYQRSPYVRLPYDSGVDDWVLCNVNP